MYLFDDYHCPKCHGLTYEGYEELVCPSGGSADEWASNAAVLEAEGVDLTQCCCNKQLFLDEVHSRTYASCCFTHTGIRRNSFSELVAAPVRHNSCRTARSRKPLPYTCEG